MKSELLKVGDRVLVRESYGWHGCRHKPGTVIKVTPSGIDAYPPHGTNSHEKKFKASGWEWGRDNYRGDSLEEFSQETLNREIYDASVEKARRYLEDSREWLRKLTSESIVELSSRIKAMTKEQS